MFKRFLIPILLLSVLSSLPGLSQDTTPLPTGSGEEMVFSDPAWVLFKTDTLFSINARLGPYTAAERAELIERHIKLLSQVDHFVKDSFNITTTTGHTIIDYSGYMIAGITDADAAAVGSTKDDLAVEYIDKIHASIKAHTGVKGLTEWLYRIGMTLLLLGGLILIFYLLNRLFKVMSQKLVSYESKLKRKRKNLFRYLAPRGPKYFSTFVLKILRYALYVVILILYLPLLFSFFPWTKHLVYQFYGYLMDPILAVATGLYEFLPNLFFIIVIIILARYIVRIMTYVSREIEDEKLQIKGFHKDWAKPTFSLLKFIVYVFALVFLFPHLPGSDSPAFQGISIFLGVLLSLGSTSAIANLVAGLVITYMRPFAIGDRVSIAGTIGEVVEKTMLVTRIRTLKNEDVTIPNATIINNHLWNYSKNASDIGIILHTSVTIGYDVPWEKVNQLLLQAAKNTPNLTRDPKPFVLQKGLNDFYVEYELNVYTKNPGKMAIFYSELHKHILEVFNEAGIEILSPHYHAIRDGNESTIPNAPDTRNPVEKVIDKASGK